MASAPSDSGAPAARPMPLGLGALTRSSRTIRPRRRGGRQAGHGVRSSRRRQRVATRHGRPGQRLRVGRRAPARRRLARRSGGRRSVRGGRRRRPGDGRHRPALRPAPDRCAVRRSCVAVCRARRTVRRGTASGSMTGPSALARRLRPAETAVKRNDSHGTATSSSSSSSSRASRSTPSATPPAARTAPATTPAPRSNAPRPQRAPAAVTAAAGAGATAPGGSDTVQAMEAYAKALTPAEKAAAFNAAMATRPRPPHPRPRPRSAPTLSGQ